jgi:hypothetical protein
MPHIIVVADDEREVLYRERVVASHFDGELFPAQLAERLMWAVGDAPAEPVIPRSRTRPSTTSPPASSGA